MATSYGLAHVIADMPHVTDQISVVLGKTSVLRVRPWMPERLGHLAEAPCNELEYVSHGCPFEVCIIKEFLLAWYKK
ncbi:MAG: hypothetical protein ABI831_08870 [Betaproteobacteria bacterium]